jgi:L-ascorbate metabolism protein UlaG (beta-lactamase superfamily)
VKGGLFIYFAATHQHMKKYFAFLLSFWALLAQGQSIIPDTIHTNQGPIKVFPMKHASFALEWAGLTVYIDPTSPQRYINIDAPGLILITDIHRDHFDTATLLAVSAVHTLILAPQAVADKFPEAIRRKLQVLRNGETKTTLGISIQAVPMYNLPDTPGAFHTKGRGNGYVLTMGGKRIYISGDTEDIPEMRALKNIDVAFVCMNLPYTMDVNQAADAVLAFRPRIVYPYHYRGQDPDLFRLKVNERDKSIQVRLRNWYPE